MYDQDSFFTLSEGGQAGLLVVSTILFCLTLSALWRLCRGRAIFQRVVVACALFAGFVWLAPQVYYQYYSIIIGGLPAQWVIGRPPSALHLIELMTFRAKSDLSHHSQGALGWALVVTAILRRRASVA